MGERFELRIQTAIIKSYKEGSGYAKKWGSEFQMGVPDLVCSLPETGAHFIEVKHRPSWKAGKMYKNPMEPRQRVEANRMMLGGCKVFCFVATGAGTISNISLCAFDPTEDQGYLLHGVPYQKSKGYFDARSIYSLGLIAGEEK